MRRRTLLAATTTALGTVALSTGLAGCVRSTTTGSGDANTITVLVSADTNIQDLWQKSLIPGFTADNPDIKININFDLHGQNSQQNLSKLAAASKNGSDPGFDVIDGGFVAPAADAKLLKPYGKSELPALAGVSEVLVSPGKGAGVPYRASSVLLAYSAKVPKPPATLTELLAWIKANPGRFTYNSPKSGGSGSAFAATVLDANMPEDVQQKMRTEYDAALESYWEPGFQVLKSLNPYVYQKGVYPNGNSQVLELLANGEIDMAPVWSDQFLTAVKNQQIPDTTKAEQISAPTFTGSGSYLGVVATTKNPDACTKLLTYVLSAKAQAMIASDIAGYPVIPLNQLPQAVQDRFAEAKPDQLRPGFYSDFDNDMQKKWDEQVPGK